LVFYENLKKTAENEKAPDIGKKNKMWRSLMKINEDIQTEK
jgi:hypothetical protein